MESHLKKYEYILTWEEYQMEYIWGCFQAMVFMKRRDWAESLYYNYKRDRDGKVKTQDAQ